MMRVNWVFANNYQLAPELDLETLKRVGPSWGSWTTWRGCNTDNVVCHDFVRCRTLMNRAFQAVCNFYIPRQLYQDLGRPLGVKLYDGDFSLDTDHIEDIVATHLACQNSELVLLTGFRLHIDVDPNDAVQTHRARNYHGMLRSVINASKETQWVVVDHVGDLDDAYGSLENLTCDTMENVLKLLS